MPVPVQPRRATTRLAASSLLLVVAATGCAVADASGRPAAAPAAVRADQAPPDLAGHQLDAPHAQRVLVAGDRAEVRVPGGTVLVRVTGPALVELPEFAPTVPRRPARYLATFGLEITGLTGRVLLSTDDFRLLDLTDQTGTDAPVPHAVAPATATLSAASVTTGQTVTGSWTAPFTEGHGELLYAPVGEQPLALWDFRAEK